MMSSKHYGKKAALLGLGLVALSGCAAATGSAGEMLAASAGIPQMAAMLPQEVDVPAGQSMPIDGVWKIEQMSKRVKIDRGRIIAVDGWLHALTLRVQPGMVVARDITQTGPRSFTGNDLPTLGQAQYSWDGADRIQVQIAGLLAPVNLTMSRQAGVGAPIVTPPTYPPAVETPVGDPTDPIDDEWIQ